MAIQAIHDIIDNDWLPENAHNGNRSKVMPTIGVLISDTLWIPLVNQHRYGEWPDIEAYQLSQLWLSIAMFNYQMATIHNDQ